MLKTKKFNAIIALQIILTMTLYYFVLVGFTAVTYAIDLIETNNHNVDFSAYFINENGEKTDTVQSEITSEQYLYIDVSVKNEGFFKGTIKINSNNFRIKNDILSSNVSEIINNEIHLNQINAGTTETIKVAIASLEQNNISISKFNSRTDVELSGEYYYSKNIENNRSIDIHGLTNVEVKWISSNNALIEANVETLTNSVFQLNGEEKRIVQLLINSKLKNNEYPIQKTEISINSLNTIEQCTVFARKTDSTNVNNIFNSESYKYDELNKTLLITVLNEDTENISWQKNATDSFVITYILDKNEDITNLISNINTKVTLYDKKELSVDNKIVLNEEVKKIISNDIELKEKEIFKGKLYTGEEREYETISNININLKDIVEKISFKQDVSKYISGENEIIANNIYKSTIITKENVNRLLGENGYISVKDENGTIIANINNNTEADENGNIVLNYTNEPKALIFETSKPISEGVLQINSKKAILNSGLTREEINSLSGIKETTLNMYNDNNNIVQGQNIIELKNTTTKANFNVNTENLTSMEKNENVKMEVVLENTNESLDLFQNPTIKITFPKQVKDISAKCKLMYGNGLELSKANIYKENEQNIIEIDLAGTQISYNTEVVNGTTILLYADITLDKFIENSNEEIKLNYTNELASNYADNGEIKKNIKIEGLDKEIIQKLQEEEKARALEENAQISDGIKSLLKAYVGGQEIKEGDTVYTGEIVKYELTLENIGEEDIENISVEANLPEGTKCVKYIKNIEFTEDENGTHAAEDYYKEIELVDRKATNSIDLLKSKKKILLTYNVKIEDETEINNLPITININSEKYSNNLTLNCKVEKAEIRLNMYMVGRIDENKTETKRNYIYKLEIKNVKNEDISNLNIKVAYNSAVSIEHIVLYSDEDSQEIETKEEFTIETLKKDEILVYFIEVQINDNDNNSRISAIANNKYRSNEAEENLLKYIVEAELTSDNAEQEINQGDSINYNLNIKNTGNVDINRVDITQSISKYLDVKTIKINNENIEFNISYEYKDIDKMIEDYEEDDEDDITEADNYIIEYSYDKEFKVNDKIDVVIETQVNEQKLLEKNIKIESQAKVFAEESVKTEKVKHIITPADLNSLDVGIDEMEETNDDDKNNEDNNTEDDSNNSSNESESKNDNNDSQDENVNSKDNYSISGSVWFDKNENGTRDNSENMIDDVKIQLYNLQDNSIKETTSINGKYNFNELSNGKYILIFEYNKEKYILTKYKANGANEKNNSDVEIVSLNINGKEQKVAATDTIEINSSNISNIDLGLIEAKKFDLELTKTIGKITISNLEGNTVKEYDNTNMAKVEIAAKYLSGSTIVIEYNISVKNTGELAGYAKQIVDYLPKDLTFNSSLNKDWYQSGEYIYTNSLADKKIEAGETKELKLIVTKKMTESNTGLVNNTAELTSAANSQNIEDLDSTPGNKQTNEDDLGSANVIISVKTGAVISYLTITILITGLIFFISFVITKRFIKE